MEIATEITEKLGINRDKLQIPTNAQLEKDINLFSEVFLPNVYQEIQDKKIVLLLDEFDVANKDISDINIVEQQTLFPYLKSLLKEQDKLFIIPVIGRYLNDLPNLLSLFKGAPSELIGLLDDTSAKRMIVNPAEGILTYESEAIKEILQLSARHPCFTQVICSALFEQARENNKWSIERADVECILKKAIETADSFSQSFWHVLTVEERIIMSAVAEAQKIAIEQKRRVPEEPLDLLKKKEINQTEQLSQAWNRLIENHYLSEDGRKLRVELIRCWLLQYHSLENEIQSLKRQELQTQENENVEDIVKNLLGVAKFWSEQGKHELASQRYEQALTINPNNFNIKVSLAEQYLQVQDYSKSLELHKQLFQVDSQSYKEGYIDALSEYGHHLIITREYTQAKEQYNKILEIEPNRKSAIQKILEIETYEKKSITTTPDKNHSRKKPKEKNSRDPNLRTTLAVVTVLVLGSVGYGTYQFSSDCPPGKQKEFDLLCIEDKSKISNGARTLFPTIKNSFRDQGIKAFQQEKYDEAIKLFGEAVKANPNDPEVLIYHNNARAKQKGKPFTLAVAVPADNYTLAQETLRGVSQAQHEFNNNGLNRQLLEIKIANDAGQPEQAKQVAAELVKDSSILGIIGHSNSDSTKAALEQYNKTDIDIAVISPSSTSTQLLGKRNFFRSVPSDAAGGKKLAEYAFKTLKLTKIVIFSNPESSYSDSMREEFTKTFEYLGGKVLHKPQINLTDATLDIDSKVNKSIYGHKAEAAVLIPDRKNIGIALKIARLNQDVAERFKSQNRNRSAMKLLGGDTLYSNEILSQGGNAVENLIVVVPWFREAPHAKDFAEKAKKQWGGEVSWRTATSYDATQAFIQALSPDSERTTVIEKLKNINFVVNNTNTSGDPLQFNSEGERQTEPILVQIQGGKWVMPPQ
ncbi:ABC-type branched-chain amino acid transport system, periplasmic component [Nostoc flagelliforme CCNUN1]|uniref:ABC-type branched-chain amino acid transport system, periplasmic component n=2 Tax=Nostoc flagelliforme TaxID=1306274 RepID=A0A2K8SVZ5_9NOSO|nr:ABC-type branched-chain amino acid transport system, periplasmic component [Nostoc flagelliforme CCNUN1]